MPSASPPFSQSHVPDASAPVFGLIRYSSDEQGEGSTEGRQRESVTAYCERVFGHEPNAWIEDPGVTAYEGHNLLHGKVARFKRDVEAGRVPTPCHLVVESVDRLSRAPVMMANAFTSALMQAGVAIHVVRRSLIAHRGDSNAIMSLLPLLIDAEAANRDNKNRSDNVQKNVDLRRLAAINGESTFMDWCPGWLKPQRKVGDTWIDVQSQGRGARRLPGERRFVWRPEHLPTLQRMCEWTAEGAGGQAIAKRLNSEGYAPWGKATMWHAEAVQEVVRSRALIGEFHPHKTKRDGVTASGKLRKIREPFIDDSGKPVVLRSYYPAIPLDLWQRMERARKTNGRRNAGRPSPRVTNLFAGLCRCGICGASMQTTGNKRRGWALICRTAKGAKCDNKMHSLTRLERALLRDDLGLLRRALEAGDDQAQAVIAPLAARLAEVEAELAGLEKRVANLTAAIRDADTEEERRLDQAERRNVLAQKTEREAERSSVMRRIEDARLSGPDHALVEADLLVYDACEGNVEARERLAGIFRQVIERIEFANGVSTIRLARPGARRLVVEPDGTLLIEGLDGRKVRRSVSLRL